MKIFLSVPILDRPEFKSIYSIYQSILSCSGHEVRLYVNENDSLISRIRNVHMSIFYEEYKDYDYFMSIDSDIEIVNCFRGNNIFDKLIAADKEFVGGLYALKQFEKPPMCSSIPISPEFNRSTIPFNKGLIEMLWLSSGCWCIKRSAMEKMVKAYPELDYVGDDNVAGKPIHGLCIPAIFEVNDGNTKFKKYLSEDWAYTARWKAIGGKVFADTSIVLKHHGKIPFSLWNVQVVQKKKEDAQQAPQMPTVSTMPRFEQPKNPSLRDLPPVGFDLDLMKNVNNAKDILNSIPKV